MLVAYDSLPTNKIHSNGKGSGGKGVRDDLLAIIHNSDKASTSQDVSVDLMGFCYVIGGTVLDFQGGAASEFG
jgi:hypothetical protein